MFVYKDGHIDYIQTSEGRLKWDDPDSVFYAEYYIKDHLGNVRSVVTSHTGQSYAIQGTDYYPFGLEIPVYGTSDNQIKYNSKELQTEARLDWYDYGARFYDPQLARWHSVDPLAEKSRRWSPYSYCLNNPIRFIDPDGMKVDEWDINKKGEVKNRGENKNEDSFHIVDSDNKRIEGQSISFKYGTVITENQTTEPVEGKDGKTKPENITTFELKGDKNASNLFEFFADTKNTNVEWTHAKIGEDGSEKNIVGTSHDESSTVVGSYLRNKDYTLKEVNHNHPNGTSYPSGPDLKNRNLYLDKNSNTKMNIYTEQNGYSPYTTLKDILKFYPPSK